VSARPRARSSVVHRRAIATVLAAAGVAGLAGLCSPTSAGAAAGVFVWTGGGSDTPIPFPSDDQCYPTPSGSGANNYTAADAFFYADAACTTGSEAGSTGPFSEFSGTFESVRVRTPAN